MSFFLFLLFSLPWGRERVIAMLKKGVGKNTYLLTGSFGEYFLLFYGLANLFILALAWRHKVLLVQDSFHFLQPEFSWDSVHHGLCSKNWFSLPLFLLTEEGVTSTLGFWPIISLFSSFPWSQNANICWLSLWPTFFTFSDRPWGIDLYYSPLLTVILWAAC